MAVTRLKPLYDQAGTLKGYVDKYTGEEYGFPVIIGRKRNPYAKGWVMNSQEAMIILAKDKDIKGETHRVLWFIGGILDFENWVQLSVTKIAQELELKRPNVSRAIKLLEEKEIILRGPKVGRSYAFMLNPEFGWKGQVKNLDEYRRERDELEHREKKRSRTQNNLKLVELSKEDQIIQAIKQGKVNVEEFYSLLHKE
ncbi:helix-turn-helix domain-containing protein [Pleurocapsa sp. PCC 7319]|uniref:MarR family transcriptional regulator n=1 Tax=Pleurocapsa sp. PCC 7319 TaxID=118161 RepID=UPI000348559B|nr:helix-turn-helix domain-containing protein [Pleurocapsa sp. PCC 7319]